MKLTYEQAKTILDENNIKNKESYYLFCEIDRRFSKDPEIQFKNQFINWIDYLSIKPIYYDFETCKKKVNEYILLFPDLKKYYLQLDILMKKLCEIDLNFPPPEMWTDYYQLKNLSELININIYKKKNIDLQLS